MEANASWAVAGSAAQSVTPADALVFIRRQFWLIAGITLLALVVGLSYVLLARTEYVARAELLIEPGNQRALWQDNGVVDLTIDNAQVESQVQVLQSEQIANDVIDRLKLIDDPEFRQVGSDYERRRLAIGRFENSLSARRIGQSYVIEVSFRSADPEKAARITNAITAGYLRDQQQAKRDAAAQASQWMEEEITGLGAQLNTAAAAAQQFRVSHGITDTGVNNGQPQLIDQLTQLEAKAQAYRKVYESLLERFTENQQQASYPVSNARVITAASRPLTKAYPKSRLVLLLSVLLGLLVGLAAAAVRAMQDGTVRSAKELRQAFGLSVWGVLPTRRASGGVDGFNECSIEVLDTPRSAFSEAIRNVEISMQRACAGRAACSIGIVSVLPDDDTTTFTTNLAALCEAAGASTVLVDADLRKRQLTRRLAPEAAAGLLDALLDGPSDFLLYERQTGAQLLPAVDDIVRNRPPQPLGGPATHNLLEQLKQRFQTILVALPALQHPGDARALAPFLDGCVLVVAYGRTPLHAIEDAIEQLRADGVPLFGVVVTEFSDDIQLPFGLQWDRLREFDLADMLQRLSRLIHQRSERVGPR
jgi:Mrp family chromosome partitioning ATPase/capsular polysaccharide biosynthesis protein